SMIELLRKDQPRVAAMLDSPLGQSKDLLKAFLYAQGARYVKALKEKGGWLAVNRVYAFSPGSTAAILAPGEQVSPIDLGPGKKLGALELIERLRESRATRDDAVQSLAGWRGDREVDGREGRGTLVVFSTPEQARSYREALGRFLQTEFPEWKVVRQSGEELIGKTAGQQVRAVLQRGNRVLALEAKDPEGLQRLR